MKGVELQKYSGSKVSKRPWTTNEIKTLRTFAGEGLDGVYEAMRDEQGNATRTRKAIKEKASELHVSLDPRKAEVCPHCWTYPLREGTSAARHGYCVPCWNRHLAEIRREKAAVERSRDEYEAAKKQAQRARRRNA